MKSESFLKFARQIKTTEDVKFIYNGIELKITDVTIDKKYHGPEPIDVKFHANIFLEQIDGKK